jgi:nucleotide-binding universal stress UspA family protein
VKELIHVSARIPEQPIVVGVDGSAASVAALVWARDEAEARRAPLVIVHVLDPRNRAAAYSPARTGREAARACPDRIKELIDVASTGPVEHVAVIGNPSVVLVERSRGARVLVLGQSARHHRRDGEDDHPGPALGPVARACLARAACPVLVLPESAHLNLVPYGVRPPHRTPVTGARAIYPYQGRIPVAHH